MDSENDDSLNISINNAQLNKKKAKLIKIGECSRFYLYLLGATISKLISIFLLGGFKNNMNLFGFSPILKSYNIIQSLYTYIGYIIFSFIFRLCSKHNEITSKKNKLIFIYNNFSKPNYKKFCFQIFLVSFCFAFYYEAINILNSLDFQLLNFWSFETIFTFLLMQKYFKFDIYNHHKCSIYFIIISSSLFILIASLIPVSSGEEEKLNAYQKIKRKFGSYYYSIIIILIYIIISFIFAFSRIFSKILMQIKNISYYTLIPLISINGLLISVFSYIILNHINLTKNLLQYFDELNSCDKDYKYYLEIFLIYPIFVFIQFIQIYFELLIIYYLNPNYLLATYILIYGFTKLVSFVSNNFSNFISFIFIEMSEICPVFGYLIFLEILELNFCGLSDNIKRNIKSKSDNEFKELFIDRIETIESLNNEIDEEGNNLEDKKMIEMTDKTYNENEYEIYI